MDQNKTDLEGTIASQTQEFEIEGTFRGVERPTCESFILVSVSKDDGTCFMAKYDYANINAAKMMEDNILSYRDKRVKLKIGEGLNKSGDYFVGLGPIQLIKREEKSEEKSKNTNTHGFNPENRFVIGKLNAIKIINSLLETHLFSHGITCEPVYNSYYNHCYYESSDYEYVDSKNSNASQSVIYFARVNKGVFFGKVKNMSRVAHVLGLGENLTDRHDIFDDQGLHNINIAPIPMKSTGLSTSEYESGILVPLGNFAKAYEKTTEKKAFMRVDF